MCVSGEGGPRTELQTRRLNPSQTEVKEYKNITQRTSVSVGSPDNGKRRDHVKGVR